MFEFVLKFAVDFQRFLEFFASGWCAAIADLHLPIQCLRVSRISLNTDSTSA